VSVSSIATPRRMAALASGLCGSVTPPIFSRLRARTSFKRRSATRRSLLARRAGARRGRRRPPGSA
jgi:hypothetical protein